MKINDKNRGEKTTTTIAKGVTIECKMQQIFDITCHIELTGDTFQLIYSGH